MDWKDSEEQASFRAQVRELIETGLPLPRVRRSLDTADTAIHRDDHADPFSRQPIERSRLQTVAVAQALGDEMDHIRAQQFQCTSKNHRRRDAVNVVITMNRNALATGNRLQDTVHSDRHVGQSKRVEQVIERRRKKAPRLVQVSDPANAQQSCRDRGDSQFFFECLHLSVVALEGLPQTLNHSAIPTLPIFRHFW